MDWNGVGEMREKEIQRSCTGLRRIGIRGRRRQREFVNNLVNMSIVICIKCGARKSQAWSSCDFCGHQGVRFEEMAVAAPSNVTEQSAESGSFQGLENAPINGLGRASKV